MLEKDGIAAWSKQQMLDALYCNFATFFGAGSETASNAIAWLVFHLCKYPARQEKCRKEGATVLNGRHWSEMSIGDVRQVIMIRACMLEFLHIEPTVTAFAASVHSTDFTIRGCSVPKGIIIVNIKRFAATVASDLDEPLAFKPGYSLRNEQDVGIGVITFERGPRACPGRNLAEKRSQSSRLLHWLRFPYGPCCKSQRRIVALTLPHAPRGPLAFALRSKRLVTASC